MKCVYLLLKQLFFGVDFTENVIDTDMKKFMSKVCVSYRDEFPYTSSLSKIDAKNHASLNALRQLCEIENKFVQRIRNDDYPPNFASAIQEYVFLK